MQRRVVKRSDVVREGYIKGLKDARRIIARFLNESGRVGRQGFRYVASIDSINVCEINSEEGEVDHRELATGESCNENEQVRFNTEDELKSALDELFNPVSNGRIVKDDGVGLYTYMWETADDDGNVALNAKTTKMYEMGMRNIFRQCVYLTVCDKNGNETDIG